MALILTSRASKCLRTMPRADMLKLMEKLEAIAATPHGRHPATTALVGRPGAFRLRHGDWRAIFVVDGNDIRVDRIGHRSEVYEL